MFGLDRFAGPIFTFAPRMQAHSLVYSESAVSGVKQNKSPPIPDRSQVVDIFCLQARKGKVFLQPILKLDAECRVREEQLRR
jgi:hypothetical protein